MMKMTTVKFVIPCLLFAAAPSFAKEQFVDTVHNDMFGQTQGQAQAVGQTPVQIPGQVSGVNEDQSQRLAQALANGASPAEAMRLAQEQNKEFDINAAIEKAVGENDGKLDQGCIQILMEEAEKNGVAEEVVMFQQLLRKYPRQLSLIRHVGLKNCSKGAFENCRKAAMVFSAEKSKSNETASKSGMEDKKKSGGRDERSKSTSEKSASRQFSNSSDYKINSTESVRDTESMRDTDSDGNTASYINLSQNQRTVLLFGGTNLDKTEESRASP